MRTSCFLSTLLCRKQAERHKIVAPFRSHSRAGRQLQDVKLRPERVGRYRVHTQQEQRAIAKRDFKRPALPLLAGSLLAPPTLGAQSWPTQKQPSATGCNGSVTDRSLMSANRRKLASVPCQVSN